MNILVWTVAWDRRICSMSISNSLAEIHKLHYIVGIRSSFSELSEYTMFCNGSNGTFDHKPLLFYCIFHLNQRILVCSVSIDGNDGTRGIVRLYMVESFYRQSWYSSGINRHGYYGKIVL